MYAILALSAFACEDPQPKYDMNGSVVIDVRTKQEYDQGHLKNAVNIPYDEIKGKIKNHVKDINENIIVYCRSGRRSGIAKKNLDDMGYKNVINAGAYRDLIKTE